MSQAFASICNGIVYQIEELEALRAGLQQELLEASPALKPFLLREIRQANISLSLLRQELRDCMEQNPPGPRPDLQAKGVKANPNHAARTVGFAALIKNIGQGIAYGPFDIALSVSLYRGGGVTSFVRVFEVPAGTALFGVPVAEQIQPAAAMEQPAAMLQPVAGNGFSGARIQHHPTPSQEYITEEMVLPLYYWDDSPSARYHIQFVVDSEHRVVEVDEGNNQFEAKYWTVNPQSQARTSMLVVEEKTIA